MTTASDATYTVAVDAVGPVPVTVTERGEGRPVLLLHGGGGAQTVAGFAEFLAADRDAWVLTPTHPGFGGTQRPEALTTIRGLAALYVALLDEMHVSDVTVVGNSIGGWIAAEMGLIGSPRISGLVLVDAVGIVVPGHPVADFFALTMDQVVHLSYHDPDKFTVDLSAMPEAQRSIMAGNRSALAIYGGTAMADPTLRERLAGMTVATMVVWGDSDQIVDPDYGRAYARAIPTAQFQLLTATGHLPQIETPAQLASTIWRAEDAPSTNLGGR